MQAIVLAGGLGTRLRPRVDNVPKPMAPVAGRPFLAWLLDSLEAQGFRRVVLSVGYRRDIIMDAFGTRYRSLDVTYAVEEVPLGTGGALRQALSLVPADDPVWVMNGDTFLHLSYRPMFDAHAVFANMPDAITMALVEVEDSSRYGAVRVRDGRVSTFLADGVKARSLINAGTYLIHRDLFQDWRGPHKFSFERDFLAPGIAQLNVRPFVTKGWFLDIGTPADYDRAQTALPNAVSFQE